MHPLARPRVKNSPGCIPIPPQIGAGPYPSAATQGPCRPAPRQGRSAADARRWPPAAGGAGRPRSATRASRTRQPPSKSGGSLNVDATPPGISLLLRWPEVSVPGCRFGMRSLTLLMASPSCKVALAIQFRQKCYPDSAASRRAAVGAPRSPSRSAAFCDCNERQVSTLLRWWSPSPGPRSIPLRPSPRRSCRGWTCPCAERSLSPGGFRTRSPSWSKLTPDRSAWANISTISANTNFPAPSMRWSRIASTPWGWTSTPRPARCCRESPALEKD